MTRHETFTASTIAEKKMVLATDLDGTFLGGSKEDRDRFYSWIQRNRSQIGLIFVTGRDPGFITQMVRKGLPRPDYVVGDVGTTIAEFGEDNLLAPIAALETAIAEAWGDSGPKVQAALRSVSGIRPQAGSFRHRASYDLDPARFDRAAIEIIEEMGFDALMSDDRFLDVLPKGVSKGPSLLRLLDHLNVNHAQTLVAGDTLNDLSMLTMGLPAVAVGGSEQGLIDRVADLDHVLVAKGEGVAGIAEAILHHNLFAQQ